MKRKLISLAVALLCSVGMWADIALNAFSNVAGSWGGSGGVTNNDVYLVERYYGSRPVGLIMAQSVSSLPNGTYDVEVYAHACHANGVGGDFADSNNTLSVNGTTQTVATIDNSDVAKLPMDVYTFNNVTVTDGTMNISLKSDAAGANWFTIKVKRVTLKGSFTNYALTNSDFSAQTGNSQTITGWDVTGFVSHVNGDGFTGTFAEMWTASNAAMGAGSLSQTVNDLPAGTYMLSANIRSRRITSYLYASIGGKEQKHAHIGDDGIGVRALTFVVTETSNVTVGFKHSGNSAKGADKWVAIDDITLTRLGDVGETALTSQIANPSFESGDLSLWTNSDMEVQTNMAYGDMQGHIYAQKWHSTGEKSIEQTLSGLPKGKYKLTAKAQDGGGTGVKLYAGEEETTVTSSNDYDVTFISDGSDVEIGYEGTGTSTSWLVVDNFRLMYYGPCIMHKALELPDNGAMAADTWYYFNPGAGSFKLTATDLSDIVYTTDGTTLASAAVSTTFGANPVALSNSTYYIKSSTANTFAYEVCYDVTAQVTAYNTAVTNAGTAKTNAEAADKVNAAEKTALDNAITTYGSVEIPADQTQATYVQKEALETATAALTSATNAVNTSITAYANAKTYFDAVEPVLATTNFYTSAAYTTNYPKAAYDAGTLSDVDAAALSYGSRRDGNMPAILLSSWAGTTLYINTWSTESEGVAPARDFANPFFEYWVADGNNLAATTFTSTIGGLTANALYAVTLNARVKQRDKNVKITKGITMSVGNGDAVDLTQGQHIAMSRRFIDSYTAYGYTDNGGNLVTTITVAANSNISWLAFRDVNYARVEGASALDEVIAEVTDLNGHVPTNVYSTAYTAVTNHTDANYPTTDDEFATAISDIRTAAATAAAYKDEYEAYLELKDYADALVAVQNNNSTANSTLATAISTAASNVNSVADVAGLTSVNTTLKAAMVTYAGAANPVGDGNKFDLTFMLGKVNFDDCISWENPTVNGFSGWYTDQGDGNFQVMQNNEITNGVYHSFMEYWSSSPKTSGFNLYTTVEDLPEGTYTMSCYAFANANDYAGAAGSSEVYFYANDTQGGKVTDSKLTQKEISFVNTSVQDVKIGLKPVAGNTWRWMGIGYVKMYKTPAAADVVLDESSAYVEEETAADVLLTKTIFEGWNTVVLPFSMTAEEIGTVFGEGSLYAFSDADAGVLNFSSASSLSAHTPYLFKADAEKLIDGERISGRTITVSSNSLTVSGTDYNFVGTYTPYAKGESPIVVGNDYVLGADDCFHQATVKNALKAFRAYIQANEPSEVKALRIVFDDDLETRIEDINVNGSLNLNGDVYDLSGRRVSKTTKGLYIVNGKKVVIK